MFTSLRARLLIINLGLILLGFGSLTLWAGWQMEQTAWDDYGNNQTIYALLLANQLVEFLEENPARSQAVLQESADKLSAEIGLFDANGNLVYSTGQPMTLINSGSYVVVDGMVQSSAEITYENRAIGYVQISTSAEIPQTIIRQRSLALGAAFLIFSLLGIVITVWLLNTLTKPLASLRNGALQIADGDLDYRLTGLPRNEIGAVGTAFNTMAEKVSTSMEEQRAFASNASHELRTPLTTIRLRTEALQRGVEPAIQEQYIDEIDSEAQRLSRLVEDLLLLSRLDAHRLEMGSEQIDLVRLLHILVQEYTPLAAEKEIALTVEMPATPLLIAASLSHGQIVFRNLIDNAIKYTPAQGAISIQLTEETGRARVFVTDNGRGIEAENLPHIGQRFYRTDKARNRQTAGIGLGLALVQSILMLYGGQFEIFSAGIGQGTRVQIAWPLLAVQDE